jgi:hypothetical protein
MTESFAALKRSRETSMERLTKELDKFSNQTKKQEDDRFWRPEVDKSGNGYAVIRFLPAPQGEDVPWVRLWSHGFQGAGGWYIENSLTTINQQDPVGELNSKLWNSGNEKDKEQARKQKRKLNYIANIYVVKDPAHPENEGKVLLFKFGKKIFDKLNEKMNPEFEDESPINPFDMWQGANFKLKIRNVENYRNYDKSEFDDVSELGSDDDEREQIWKSEHALQKFLAPDQFKSYAELSTRLDRVLKSSVKTEEDENPFAAPKTAMAREPGKVAEARSAPAKKASFEDDDDEDALAMFEKLAKDD